jgi:hypothetical protein
MADAAKCLHCNLKDQQPCSRKLVWTLVVYESWGTWSQIPSRVRICYSLDCILAYIDNHHWRWRDYWNWPDEDHIEARGLVVPDDTRQRYSKLLDLIDPAHLQNVIMNETFNGIVELGHFGPDCGFHSDFYLRLVLVHSQIHSC